MPRQIYVLRSNPKRTVQVIKVEGDDIIYFDLQKEERNRRSLKSFHEKFRKSE